MQKNSAKERVREKRIVLDTEKVKEFFDTRCQKKLPYLYNYTNYQDKRPELALERDRAEKERVLPLLSATGKMQILDIGCGVGRWGDAFFEILKEGHYVGVDYSEGLLQLAKDHAKDRANYEFYCARFQEVAQLLPQQYRGRVFDRILVNGVLMYINDDEIGLCLSNIKRLLSYGGVVYLKESVSYDKRLTLNQIYSEELTHEYSAIYRSIAEYEQLFQVYLPIKEGWHITACGEVWENTLENRKETTAYFWILEYR